jgi:hypothetical protein
MQNFYDTVGAPIQMDAVPNISSRLLDFANAGNLTAPSMGFLNFSQNNNQNFLGGAIAGNSAFLSHQTTPLSNAITLSQITQTAMLPSEIKNMTDLSYYQVQNMANVSNSVLDTIKFNNQNSQRNAQAQSSGGSDWGWLGTAASVIGSFFSDRRLKRNIIKIGKLDNGLNLYMFEYIWDESGKSNIGVMADEVLVSFPDAIIYRTGNDGVEYMMVDYMKIGGPVNGH